jgi:hypothetical protein
MRENSKSLLTRPDFVKDIDNSPLHSQSPELAVCWRIVGHTEVTRTAFSEQTTVVLDEFRESVSRISTGGWGADVL